MARPRQRKDVIDLGQEPIWEMQFDETLVQYRAFCLYRDLGYERSLSKVAQMWPKIRSGIDPNDPDVKLPKASTAGAPMAEIGKWSSRNRWVERAEAYTRDIEQRFRESRETEVGRMIRQELSGARGLMGHALQRIYGDEGDPATGRKPVAAFDSNTLEGMDVYRAYEIAAKGQRQATGRATDYIKGAMMVAPADFIEATSALVDLALAYIPVELQAAYADDVRALSTGERRILELNP